MFWNRPRTDETALLQRVEALETQVKLLRVEWEEVYDKVSNALARARKRERDAEKPNAPHDEADPAAKRAALWRQAAPLLRGGDHVRR